MDSIGNSRSPVAKEIAIIASTGVSKIKVSKNPAAVIVSTGDELIDLNTPPATHQVRMTNKYMLGAALNDLGIAAESKHFPDDRDILIQHLTKLVNHFNLIIITGGVSAGKYDHIPEILEASGVTKHFHKVNQRPGKPFWFGSHENGCTVFALPGNPVSAFMCFVRYIRPWILKSLLTTPLKQDFAILASPVTTTNQLTTFINVALHHDDEAKLIATPTPGHGSGDFTALEMADAFLELPPGPKVFKIGEVFPVYKF